MLRYLFLLLFGLPVLACCQALLPGDYTGTGAMASQPVAPEGHGDTVRGVLINADAQVIGSVEQVNGPNGLLFRVLVDTGGLTPGWHGLHLHEIGTCDDPGVFKRSGGHVGKRVGAHGLLNKDGPEAGDLPNIWVAPDGSAGYEAFTNLATVSMLDDQNGTALIIHARRDDHISQPIGGAGTRIACAVIF